MRCDTPDYFLLFMPLESRQFPPEGIPAVASPHGARCSIHGNLGKTPRNLVVCIDGTANKFGRNHTNVVKLFDAVDCDSKDPLPEQYTYYLSGIGTRPRVVHVFKRIHKAIVDKLDMAIAWNMEEIVKDAYGWLAGKYQEGDQIYLFGFSRGAYQVRILAWMIYEVGLIKNPTERQIGSAYDHFVSIMSYRPNASDMARDFRRMFSWKDLRVHFIGVWDMVSSVGFGRGDIRLSSSSTAAHACHIRHALALDELRVKFVPEYFLEMNSPDLRRSTELESDGVEGGENRSGKAQGSEAVIDSVNVSANIGSRKHSNDDIVLEKRNDKPEVISSRRSREASNDKGTNRKAADIKEVWFSGSHSDVGGKHRPGKSSHAGKVSLMWMHREASASGLILKPEDIFWTDDDLDYGTTSSMSLLWKLVEFLPLRHQVSFSGSGENARKSHLFKPRRIIPGQKIHASVRFAHTYVPKATFGNGFGIPLETATPTAPREDDIWEDAIDRTTYIAIFDNLRDKQGTEEYYLHRLLFLQRFSSHQWPVEELSNRWKTLTDLITEKSGLVRLAAIAAFAEAADHFKLNMTLPDRVLEEASESLTELLNFERQWKRAVCLLPPIAKHENLRNLILTDGVIDSFLQLLDHNIMAPGVYFPRVMDALSSLVKFDPQSITKKFAKFDGREQKDRLLLMLNTNDPCHLIPALRVVVSFAEQVPDLCLEVKPRLRELARKHPGPIGLLALKALTRLGASQRNPQDGPARPRRASSRTRVSGILERRSTGGTFLYRMFSARARGNNHREVVKTILTAADGRDTRTRTAATFTLLKLRQANAHLKTYLPDVQLLDLFVKQLQFKDSALLAAYALTECLADGLSLSYQRVGSFNVSP
ncbi:hypothetical protein JVU11DRAFT_10963 [Chiua virens]|nr:hypothetical protein JVU11DRAFT_10963 [Chiua virens]